MAITTRPVIGIILVLVGVGLVATVINLLTLLGLILIILGLILISSWAFEGGISAEGMEGRPGSALTWPRNQGSLIGLRDLWRSGAKGASIDLLRVGVGLIWVLNLIFIVDPANQFFSTFQQVALSYGPTTLGGPGLANFVAANATVFAWLTAVVSTYLAIAFVLGVTTRLACVVGAVVSVVFLWTQFWSTFQIPGGTDVGAHPLYLLIYLVLFVGAAGKYWAIDHWIWATGRAKFPRLARWLATPRQ